MNLIEIMEACQGHDKCFLTRWLTELGVPTPVKTWILRSMYRGKFIGLPHYHIHQGGHGAVNYKIIWKEKRKRK